MVQALSVLVSLNGSKQTNSLKEQKKHMRDTDQYPDSGLPDETQSRKERLVRQLAQIVCICKGIPLSRVLEGLRGSSTPDEVNSKTGCGSGGCQGQRCGPKIRALLKKKKEQASG